MRFGASTFIWVSPFSNKTLDLIDRVNAFGFDLIEVCVEDPDTIDLATIRGRITKADLGVTICGAFGPNRDLSSETSRFGRPDSPTFAVVLTSRRRSDALGGASYDDRLVVCHACTPLFRARPSTDAARSQFPRH